MRSRGPLKYTIALRGVLLVVALVFPHASAISRDELYTHGPGLDKQLPQDDEVSSEEIQLRVPIIFYGQEYSSIFVNMNGLLSFRTDIPSFINTEFPLEYPVISPFYSNVDTRKSGVVFYRETQDAYIIARATEDIQKYFENKYDFQPTSVFIATWADVGYHPQGADKFNTFQVAIISNGRDSFVEFLYPENGIQWIQGIPQLAGLPDARAQVGLVGEDGRYFLFKGSGTDHIRMIAQMSNSETEGLFLFHVGNIPAEGNVNGPEQHVSAEDIKSMPTSCSQGGSHQCHVKAQCIDNSNGFCCVCLPGYYGNGKSCLKNDVPLRVNGKVFGELNGALLDSMDLQAYVVMSDGRSYTAISKVPDRIGYDMQTLNVIGGVIGWLFARPISEAKNGYQLTGGVFNHTAEILFHNTGHKVTVRQYYTGLDLFDQLKMEADIKGSIPNIPAGTKLDIGEYEEQYSSPSPGIILSQSSRSFKNKGLLGEHPFTVEQSITYNVCPYLPPEDLEVKTYTLKVAKNFIGYESREQIVRYGMSNKAIPLGQEDPCIKGRETCGDQSSCITEGDSFKCICNPGYHYIYPNNGPAICVDINECSTGTSTCDINAQCFNQEGSFSCKCNDGFEGDGVSCQRISACEKHRCDQNAQCFENNGRAYCHCNEGFTGDGERCWQLSEAGCEVLHNCSPFASCIDSEYSGYTCRCIDGYVGDGYTCNPENNRSTTELSSVQYDFVAARCILTECWCPRDYVLVEDKCYRNTENPTTPYEQEVEENGNEEYSCNVVNRCHPYAQCIFIHSTGDYQCQCTAGYEGNGIECTETEVSCEEVDICDLNAQCIFDPATSKSICICNAGFIGDGNVCHSKDECVTSVDCDENAECISTDDASRRECVCIRGYRKDLNDVCMPESGSCNGVKCAEYASCKWDSDYKTYYCECDSGYQGSGIDICTPITKGCNIINDCGLNAVCQRDPVTAMFKCFCKIGFYGDGYVCTRDATCEYNMQLCSNDATCTERNHQFVCECNPGFIGNGQICEKAPKHEGNFLLLNQGMATLRVPFEPTSRDPGRPIHISYFQMAIGLDIDCAEGRVYWSDITGRTIKSSKYDGTSIDSFLVQDIISPEGLSVDWVSRNIYWTDSRRDTIEVANLDTKVRKVLFNTSLVDPRGIAVHPVKGKIFWSDWNRDSPKIEWSNMDGTGRGIFMIGEFVHLPNSLAIDWSTEELCYADAGIKSIECVNIDTRERRTIATNCSYPFGLAITDTHYYWTDWATQKIESLNKRNDEPRKSLDVPLGRGSGNKLYGMAAVPEECYPLSNICQYDNGRCPQNNLCLLDGQGGRRCVCGINPDNSEQCPE